MKYCEKCGTKLVDEALFCSKCGNRVATPEVEEPVQEEASVKPVMEEAPAENSQPVKKTRKATPIHEQKIKEFLPVTLALIVASIIIWIINSVGSLSGVAKIAPLLIFMMLSVFLAVMSMIRGVKTLLRAKYLIGVLSLVLFVLLFTCFIIDFVFLVG